MRALIRDGKQACAGIIEKKVSVIKKGKVIFLYFTFYTI